MVGLLCTAGTHGGDGNSTHSFVTSRCRHVRYAFLNSCDDHTTPSCLAANSPAESRYRSMHTLALPDPSLTQWGLVTLLACAVHWPFVRSCDLAHHGLYCSHVCAHTHTTARCSISLFGVCPRSLSVLTWKNIRTCGCLMAPQAGITLLQHKYSALRTTLSPTATIWCEHPRPLCKYWPPHGSHMVRRLQALCPAHRLHTVPSVHRLRRAPLALS